MFLSVFNITTSPHFRPRSSQKVHIVKFPRQQFYFLLRTQPFELYHLLYNGDRWYLKTSWKLQTHFLHWSDCHWSFQISLRYVQNKMERPSNLLAQRCFPKSSNMLLSHIHVQIEERPSVVPNYISVPKLHHSKAKRTWNWMLKRKLH